MKINYTFNPDASWGPKAIAQLEAAHSLVTKGNPEHIALADELAAILNHLNVDQELIVAGFLYEAFNADARRSAEIEPVLGSRIASAYAEMVRLLDPAAPWHSGADLKSGAHQLMLLSMMKDVRLSFLLLGHQLLRMRHLKGQPEDVIKREAQFTRYVFAPMANRLGIGQLKWELEDLAFRFSRPEEYKRIAKALEERRVDRERYIRDVVGELSYALETAQIPAKVYGRPKHIYSIWKKMQNKDLDFKDLYDVRALRVMVDDITQCYSALSVVHSVWPFVHGEYDDYIAAPKPNGYQSLHTAVHGPEDKTIEVQIRTREMHDFAELGVAAHWRYKEGGAKRDEALERRIESLRMVLSGDACAVPDAEDNHDEAHIYVLTPQGKVVELAAGATPLDFAYAVHTEVGHRCRGAKVNGQMVTLTTSLSSGQEVEVITVKDARPSRDWLVPHFGYLKTSRARSKVKAWFRAQFRQEHIENGKNTLQKEVGKERLGSWPWESLNKRFNYQNVDDIYAAVGRGELGVHQLQHAVKDLQPQADEHPEADEIHLNKATLSSGKLTVQGVGDLMTSLARCCKPMPGDDVIGFITRGRGVTVHRRNCPNVTHMLQQEPDRFLNIDWGGRGSFEVDVQIEAMDRSGLLRDVTSVLAGEEVNVLAINTHSDRKTHSAYMRLSLEVRGADHLNRALARLQQVQNVIEARRISK